MPVRDFDYRSRLADKLKAPIQPPETSRTLIVMQHDVSARTSNELESASDRKLTATIAALSPWLKIDTKVVRTEEKYTTGYRCRSVYQVVWDEGHGDSEWQYAKRLYHRAVPLTAECPMANQRIRQAMQRIQEITNRQKEDFELLLRHLDAISFVSSWDDSPSSDCLVTFHYSNPIKDFEMWKKVANSLRELVGVKQITGRSRKRVVRALDDVDACVIRDTLHVVQSESAGLNNVHFSVAVGDAGLAAISASLHSSSCPPRRRHAVVQYRKPEGAFAHPNANVMCQALAWLLSHVATICYARPEKLFRLAELYCGFGAHTLAIRHAGIKNLASTTAVELDQRLVEALEENIALNASSDGLLVAGTTTQLDVGQDDAGKWARRRLEASKERSEQRSPFDIVLVDPPRQGLDRHVSRMILEQTEIAHCLYVSCGAEALVRDLGVLQEEFDVKDCLVLDLFPQTSAVETLLYLERKET